MWIVAAIMLFAQASGCGGSGGLDLHPVSGTVTLDGQPIEDGLITFHELPGDGRGFASAIRSGTYLVKTSAKRMKVSIKAYRDMPGKFVQAAPDQPKEPVREQYVPTLYNDTSTLTAEVPAGGIRKLDFTLLTKTP